MGESNAETGVLAEPCLKLESERWPIPPADRTINDGRPVSARFDSLQASLGFRELMSRVIILILAMAVIGAAAYMLMQAPPEPAPNPFAQDPVVEPEGDHDDSGSGKSAVVEPLLEGWDTPKLAMLITGELHGHFEPCGCTANQLGGMARRRDLMQKMLDKGWTITGMDLGGTTERARLQTELKFRALLGAFSELNYRVLNLGPEELRLGPDFLLAQHNPENEESLSFVSANLTFYESPDLGTPVPVRIWDVDGTKIGVTGILGQTLKTKVLSKDQGPTIQFTAPEDVLPAAIEKLNAAECDLKILLAQAYSDETKKLMEQFPDFDLVVSPGAEDPSGEAEQVGDNTTWIKVGAKGKYTGVVGYYPDSEPRFKFELVGLDNKRFTEAPTMVERMSVYQESLRDQSVVTNVAPVPHQSGAKYVGADKCGECHEKSYEIWKNTPHAKAFESLDPANKRHGYERLNGVARLFDPECLCCHVTGWNPQEVFRYQGGYLNEQFARTDEEKELSKMLVGSQCENCHGPGSTHIEMVENDAEKPGASVRVSRKKAEDKMCYTCHDHDNSPNFDFDKYWPQVEHYEGIREPGAE